MTVYKNITPEEGETLFEGAESLGMAVVISGVSFILYDVRRVKVPPCGKPDCTKKEHHAYMVGGVFLAQDTGRNELTTFLADALLDFIVDQLDINWEILAKEPIADLVAGAQAAVNRTMH